MGGGVILEREAILERGILEKIRHLRTLSEIENTISRRRRRRRTLSDIFKIFIYL